MLPLKKPRKDITAYISKLCAIHQRKRKNFASQKNKELFENNPVDYLPQYGGYCAYAMSNGFVVSSDPDAFTLVDGKLYLNYSLGVRDIWSKDIPGYIESADENWLEKTSSESATY